MKKVLIIIKKFFAIIISFIFGLFKKDNNIKKPKVNEKEAEKTSSKIITKNKKEVSRKETSNSNVKNDNIIYEVKDIEKLNDIKGNLYKIEYYLKKDNNVNSIKKLQSEFKDTKADIEYLDKKYANNSIKIYNLNDVKLHINECKKTLKYIEKDLESITIKKVSKDENNLTEEKQEIIENKEQKLEYNKEIIKKEKQTDSKESKITEYNSILNNVVLLSEIIIEKPKIEKTPLRKNEDIVKKEEQIDVNEKINILEEIEKDIEKYELELTEEIIEEVEEKKEEQKEKPKEKKQIKEKSNKKTEIKEVTKENVEKKILELNYNKKMDNIMQELNKTIILTYEQKINLIANTNRYRSLIIHILINNNIRTVRNIFERSKKRLKLMNISIRKEKSNELFIKNSINKIKTDTLYQIDSLEKEIRNNGENSIEFNKLLEKINQIKENLNGTMDYEQLNSDKSKKKNYFKKKK